MIGFRLLPKAKYYEYDDITSPVRDTGLYCLSGSTWVIVKGLLDFYGDWRSRYVQELEVPKNQVQPVTDEQWEVIQDALDLAQHEMGYDMSCDLTEALGTLTTVLSGMAASIQNQVSVPDCGCETVGTEAPEEPIETTPTIGPGEDFEDQASYNTYKCQAATTIVHQIVQTQIRLQAEFPFGLANVTVRVMAAAVGYILGSVGLVGLLALLGQVSQLVTTLLFSDNFDLDNMITELNAAYDDLVCALYEAGGTTEAVSNVSDVLSGTAMSAAEVFYIELYLQPVILNRLFTYQPESLILALASDCSACEQATDLFFTLGINGQPRGSGNLDKDGLQRTLTATQDSNGFWYIMVGVGDHGSQTYLDDCTPLPAGVAGTADERFGFVRNTNSTSAVSSSVGKACTNGVHSSVWGPSFPAIGAQQNITWFSMIGNAVFSIDVTLIDLG